MLRCLPVAIALLAGACASGPRPVVMTCRPLGDVHVEGAPLSAEVELRNESSEQVTVLGMNVPWVYRHAARFEADPDLHDPRVVADPGAHEDLALAPGASDRGDLDLTHRLVDSEGRSITTMPGSHRVRGHAQLTLDPGAPTQRDVEASCAFDVTIEPRESERGRAYAAASAAASAAGYDLARYRAVRSERAERGWSFDFVHVYPAPPGGHFTVRVAPDGTADVRHGE